MLQKITSYTFEGEQIDIEDMKIYWDTKKNQFRHKFHCCDCDTELSCMCYDTLDQATSGVEAGMICDKCGLYRLN